MKKALIFVLALVMLVGVFAACGEKETPTTAAKPVVTTAPKATDPKTTEPKTTEPKATEPGTTVPPVTEPGTTVPPVTEPGTTVPPVTEPGTTVPPVTEPGTTVPPVVEPGTTEFIEQTLPFPPQDPSGENNFGGDGFDLPIDGNPND